MDSLRLEDKCKFGELLEGDKVTVGGEGFLEDMSSPSLGVYLIRDD